VPDVPRIVRPTCAERPLVVSSPHSGVLIPPEELGYYGIDADRLRFDGDLYVDELYEGAEQSGAVFMTTAYSRFVVDLNRLRDDLSPRSVEGARRKRGPGYYHDRGLIWAVTTHAEDIYSNPLPPQVLARRIERYYDTYHTALRNELSRLKAKFGYVILLDAHSMPSRATKQHSDPGNVRADIVPGDLLGSSCASWLTDSVCDFWTNEQMSVAPNTPYRGGGIVRRHGRPDQGVHGIQVELNRSLYMDEETLARKPELQNLRAQCLRFVEALASLKPPA
jgi:N-formylglutamate amidohydrolase